MALQRGWRAVLDRASDAVLVVDEAARVRSINAAAQRLLQRSAVEMAVNPSSGRCHCRIGSATKATSSAACKAARRA